LATQREARLQASEQDDEAKAAWAAERREMYEQRERELREVEASTLEDVARQVAELEATYDFVRPPPVPRCGAEEEAVLACYEQHKGGDVLRCAPLVDAYSDCARRVAADLAAALEANVKDSS